MDKTDPRWNDESRTLGSGNVFIELGFDPAEAEVMIRMRQHLQTQGGGVTAFSEYERGKTQPHKSTVLLLELLGKHPELMQEVRALTDERFSLAA